MLMLQSLSAINYCTNTVALLRCQLQSFRYFSILVRQDDPWSKIWWVIFGNDASNDKEVNTNIRKCNRTGTRLVSG